MQNKYYLPPSPFQLLANCYLERPVFAQRWPRTIDNIAVSSTVNQITAEQRLIFYSIFIKHLYHGKMSMQVLPK